MPVTLCLFWWIKTEKRAPMESHRLTLSQSSIKVIRWSYRLIQCIRHVWQYSQQMIFQLALNRLCPIQALHGTVKKKKKKKKKNKRSTLSQSCSLQSDNIYHQLIMAFPFVHLTTSDAWRGHWPVSLCRLNFNVLSLFLRWHGVELPLELSMGSFNLQEVFSVHSFCSEQLTRC
jgi:hypothetical protein